jgi:hypothetical protein
MLAVFLGLAQAWRFFALTDRYAVNVLFWDQWDFLNAFFNPHSSWQIFTWQHGPHRQGIGFFLTGLVNDIFHWDQRAQAFAIAGVLVVAAVSALWLQFRIAGRLRWHDAVLPLTILAPMGIEVVANTPNVSHGVFPLLLVLLSCLAWTIRNPVAKYIPILILSFLATFTGFGVFMGIVTPMLLAFELWQACRRNDSRQAVYAGCALAIAGLTLAAFFHDYRPMPAVADFRFPDPNWRQYPVFVAIEFAMLCGLAEANAVSIGAGSATALVMVATATLLAWRMVRDRQSVPLDQVVFLLVFFAILFAINAAIGRMSLGLGAAMASRYFPLLVPAGIGIYLLVSNSARPAVCCLSVFACIAIVAFAAIPERGTTVYAAMRDGKTKWAQAYRLTRDVAAAEQASGFKIYPRPAATRLEHKLKWLEERKLSLFHDP